MQVILGSGGAIGIELAKELKKYTSQVQLASRNPKQINNDDKLVTCDLTNLEMVENAVSGCNVAYLVAGLQYRLKIWQKQWPLIMRNVIDACKKHDTKLVFFDNIYMYNPNKLAPMTEETEFLPSSKKGKVRAQIAKMILDEIASGKLNALIARSADFYGPGIKNSVLNDAVFNNLIMKEFVEMLYQYDRDYDFNSSKFETVFKIKPTPIDDGIKQMVSTG